MDTEIHSNPTRLNQPYRFECQKCGKCCSRSDTFVNLTFHDIIRFHQVGHFSFQQILGAVGFHIFKTPPDTEQLEKLIITPLIMTENGPALLGLRKNDNNRCVFLNSSNLCTIYPIRPNLCRTFPFFFHSSPNREPSPHMDTEMAYASKAIEFCPGIGEPYAKISPSEWLPIGIQTTVNIIEEIRSIMEWNKDVSENKIKPSAKGYLKRMLKQVPSGELQTLMTDSSGKKSKYTMYRYNIQKQKQEKERTESSPK